MDQLRGAARNFLEGGSKSSAVLATMVGRRGGFWGAERIKRYILVCLQCTYFTKRYTLLRGVMKLLGFPKILILNFSGNSSGNSYILCLLLLTTVRCTCGEKKIW